MPDLGGISTLPRQRAHSNEDDPEEAESPELAAANAVADHDYTSLGYGVSNFSSEIVQYIGGFIVRAVCKRISCTSCTEMLIEHKVTSILIFIRNNGGLIMPSPLVHHVLHTAEHILRCNSGNEKRTNVDSLVLSSFQQFCSRHAKSFEQAEHYRENPVHVITLIKITLKQYITLRLREQAKRITEKARGAYVRAMLTKQILFHHQ